MASIKFTERIRSMVLISCYISERPTDKRLGFAFHRRLGKLQIRILLAFAYMLEGWLVTAGTPSSEEWSHQITIAERMLIFAHWPAGNSSGVNVFLGEEYHDTHVFNWGSYRNLLPEVSGSRYSNRFASAEDYAKFIVIDK